VGGAVRAADYGLSTNKKSRTGAGYAGNFALGAVIGGVVGKLGDATKIWLRNKGF
jgi:hypothetical protein